MPELPEVEVTRLGICPYIVGDTITNAFVHVAKLRSFLPTDLGDILRGEQILSLDRRGKYLLFFCTNGCLLMHFGMTGHLRIVPSSRTPEKHDHVEILFASGMKLRLNDVRRFGRVHWTREDPFLHPLLAGIGPEPLTHHFSGGYLFKRSRGRKVAIQRFLMDSAVVAGVGNIYAAESLFTCGILPTTLAADLSERQCDLLAQAIKDVLAASITVGSATMDFSLADEELAYFPQTLKVYDRAGEACRICGGVIERGKLGSRSTFFCSHCQR